MHQLNKANNENIDEGSEISAQNGGFANKQNKVTQQTHKYYFYFYSLKIKFYLLHIPNI